MESVDALWRVKRAGYQMGGRLGETLAVVEQWLLVALCEPSHARDVLPTGMCVPIATWCPGRESLRANI